MRSIVIAYGPSSLTVRALKRLKYSLPPKTEITVVPATEHSLGALDPGIVTGADVGSRRLRSVLAAGDPAETILIIHDDVVMTSRGIRSLVDSVTPDTPLCVPWSNDMNTEHFVGTLPPGRQAENSLDFIEPPGIGLSIHSFRPSTIAGYATALLELAGDGFVDPRRKIHDPEHCISVAGVVAAHDGTCGEQLADPSTDPRPLLVAAMIVKDEEVFLPDSLASLRGVVDRIEVCDTGSSDDTVGLATEAGAILSHFDWNSSFADARNAVLERCRDARFVLQIDADERVDCGDPAGLRRFLATYGEEYAGFQPTIVNVEDDGEVLSSFRATRIFPAVGTRFDGPIHEVPMFDGTVEPIRGANLDLLGLRHLGYTTEVFFGRNKGTRNIDIARQAYANKRGFRTAYDLGRSLLLEEKGYSAEAARLFDEALDNISDGNPAAQAYVYGIVATNRIDEHKLDDALALAKKGMEVVPLESTAALAYAKACFIGKSWDKLVELDAWRRQTRSLAPLYQIEVREAEFGSFVAWALAEAGLIADSYERLMAALEISQESIAHWREILPRFLAAGVDIAETFGPLAEKEGSGKIVEQAAEVLPPAITAALATAYAQRGGQNPNAISVGILSGMIGDNPAAVKALVGHADLLDQLTRDALAGKAIDRGLDSVAHQMAAAGAKPI